MKTENYEIKCACGCGQTLLKYSKWGDPRIFINGHNRRHQISAKGMLGKKHTEESKRLMSEALKRAYQNKPELREMRSKVHKGKIVSEKSRLKESISQKKYFRNHPEARLKCSIQAKSRTGIKNPFFGKHHSLITKKVIGEKHKGKNMGKENPTWNGGSSFKPYTLKFNHIKVSIRSRDNFSCCLCGKNKKENIKELAVHHIDYDKKNDDPLNLITLCNSCHNKTYVKKDYWKKVLLDYVKSKYLESHIDKSSFDTTAPNSIK